MKQIPVSEIDIYADAQILEPYQAYRAFREAGPVVHLAAQDVYALSRFSDVRKAALDHRTFSSASGVATNATVNGLSISEVKTTLASDPPIHSELRKIVAAPLQPAAVKELERQIDDAAAELIDRLVEQGVFDGATDLAQYLPLLIVSRLVGLPEDGRQNMLEWAAATFNVLGPMNARAEAAVPKFMEMMHYIAERAGPSMVVPESWAARIYGFAQSGVISLPQATNLLIDYLGPSLDTTIFATGHLLNLLGTHPDQWDRLRADPSLIANAVEECVRVESPIRGFTRLVTDNVDIDGVNVAAGSRVLLLYASANRDERRWEDPEQFDITRDTRGHMGFGAGRHACAGMHLAKLEITALMKALVRRVSHFEVGTPVMAMNNVLRGIASLPVTITALN